MKRGFRDWGSDTLQLVPANTENVGYIQLEKFPCDLIFRTQNLSTLFINTILQSAKTTATICVIVWTKNYLMGC